MESAFRPAGGDWQSPVSLSSEAIPGADDPQVSLDTKGDAIVIWHRGGPFGGAVQTAYRPQGGAWQTPVNISEVGFEPQISFDREGDALAAWEHYDGSNYVVQTAYKPQDGAWQTPVDVSEAGETAEQPRLALDEQGDATAVWRRWVHGLFSYRIVQAAFMPAGGAWQAPVNITGEADELDQPKDAAEPGIAVDGQGDAVAVWAWEFGSPAIQAAFRPRGSSWQAPVSLSEEGASSPQVSIDGQGNALAVWERSETANHIVESAFRPASGKWQAPVGLSEEASRALEPQVAFDGQGDAVTVWSGENGIEDAGFVAAGPSLNSLSIPTTGVVGQPLAFSVAPLDVWSVLGETTWSFGDGASSSGTNVTHAYGAAGTYEVVLHSTDVFGNVTSTSGKVTIAAAPPTSTPSPSAPTSPSTSPVAPTVNAVAQSASTWREAGKSPVGTEFSLWLNEQATVSFRFAHRENGRMVGHRCLAMNSKNTKGDPCSRAVLAGALSFAGHSGTNRAEFRGRVSRSSRLKPGRYTLVITATNAVGERSSPKSLSFTIVA